MNYIIICDILVAVLPKVTHIVTRLLGRLEILPVLILFGGKNPKYDRAKAAGMAGATSNVDNTTDHRYVRHTKKVSYS